MYLTFDSAVATKREVYEALARLKAFLEPRGAHVMIICLPSGNRGRTGGLYEYLPAGRG